MKINKKIISIIKIIIASVFLVVGVACKNSILKFVFTLLSAITVGYGIIIDFFKNIIRREFFDEKTLMIIASVIAFIINERVEGALILILFFIGEFLEDCATDKSREKIAGLKELKSDMVRIVENGKVKGVPVDEVKIGSIIEVRKGEKVGIDGVIIEGDSQFDFKAITGESLYYDKKVGELVYSGAINIGNRSLIKTIREYKDSTVEKIISIVENSNNVKAKSQKFINKFSKIYTPVVVLLGILISIIPPLILGGDYSEWVYKGLSFLIISCPCALVISVPLAYFTGIGNLAKHGILVKGGIFIDELSKVKSVLFDKTGTLTNGRFSIEKIVALSSHGESELLKIVASIESNSTHPIGRAIVDYYKGEYFAIRNVKEIEGVGILGEINERKYFVGKKQYFDNANKESIDNNSIYIYEDKILIGYIRIFDEIKKEGKEAINLLKEMGISVAMVSGDKKEICNKIANDLSIDKTYYELMPDKKCEIVDEYKKSSKVAFVGDGINDSPSLSRANVGISMGSLGSDIAIEVSDVVIMDDDISKIPFSIKKSKLIRRKIFTNVIMALSVKLAIMLFSILVGIPIWLSTFSDVGIMLAAVLNSII